MTTSSKNIDTFRAAHQAFNERRFDDVLKLFSPEAVYHDTSRQTRYKGHDGFRQFMSKWANSFSDAQVANAAYIDAGRYVIAQFRAVGTNDGPLEESPATGNRISLPFCEVLKFSDSGLIESGAIYYDRLTMLSQLGLLPLPVRKAA